MNLRIVFEPSEEGGYTVFVPALLGCISEGDTQEQARDNIREAIALYLEPLEDSRISKEGLVEEISLQSNSNSAFLAGPGESSKRSRALCSHSTIVVLFPSPSSILAGDHKCQA